MSVRGLTTVLEALWELYDFKGYKTVCNLTRQKNKARAIEFLVSTVLGQRNIYHILTGEFLAFISYRVSKFIYTHNAYLNKCTESQLHRCVVETLFEIMKRVTVYIMFHCSTLLRRHYNSRYFSTKVALIQNK